MKNKVIKLFLRFAIAFGFLSAIADRFGFWNNYVAVWGNWDNFVQYTGTINPWFPMPMIPAIALLATLAEAIFAICLIVGFKTELFATLSGILMLIFALSMTFSIGIKPPLDYSVFSASAAAFALSLMKEKYWEVDNLFTNKKRST